MRTSTWVSIAAMLFLRSVIAAGQPPPLGAWEREFSVLPPATGSTAQPELDRALQARDYARAERILADAIARQPKARDLLIQIASVFMMDRKPLNAAIALKKADVLAPLENPLRLQLALAYIAMRRGDWARPELERLALVDPANVIPLYWLARLDYDAGQYASAIRRLQAVVAAEPAFVRAHDNLGLCFEALNQSDEAISHYREAVRLNRAGKAHTVWPALNLGILLRSRGELDEAERLFREALTYDNRFAPAHYQLGALLEQSGRPDEAVRALREAVSNDVDYAEPYYALSRIYRRQGQIGKADAAMSTFQRLHEAARTRTKPVK
jgi:tetratricopeptide (TPR) repeat protein